MRRPNFVMMMADDMGYGDFGVFSEGRVRTPFLDSLIGESVCLSQNYTGSPVCSPSRAAMLTGRYPIRTGAVTPQETLGYDRIALRERTLGDVFKANGYATGLIGKWHNGALDPRYHPNARGFDEFVGFRGGWADYWRYNLDRNGTMVPSDGTYMTDVLASDAVDFIDRHADEPFFLSVMFNAPHTPLHAPQSYVTPYIEAGFSVDVAIVYAMIEVMDRGVEQISEALRRNGLFEDTVFMFTCDNGPAFGVRWDHVPPGGTGDTTRFNCGLNGAKGSVLEGGVRVPMVMRWPSGLDSGVENHQLAHFIDWLPTFMDMADVQPIDGMRPLDGVSVLPQLRGETPPDAPRRFWQFNGYSPVGESNAAVRDGDWKLVRPALSLEPSTDEGRRLAEEYVLLDIAYKYEPERITEIRRWPEPERVVDDPSTPLLYNIADDPLEKQDLWDKHPERGAKMLNDLENWFEEVESERRTIPDDERIGV